MLHYDKFNIMNEWMMEHDKPVQNEDFITKTESEIPKHDEI